MEPNILRLANILHLTNFDLDKIWNLIWKSKFETFDCDVGNLVKTLKLNLGIEEIPQPQRANHLDIDLDPYDKRYKNISAELLKSAAEMFTLLDMCPKMLNTWFVFYIDLFQTKSLDHIILTLNRMMKDTRNTQREYFEIARKLFIRTSSLYFLKYQEIQNLLHGNGATKNSAPQMKVDDKSEFQLCISHQI